MPANYTSLISAWVSTTQPPAGVTGTGLSPTMTTDQKLAAINGWTVPGPAQAVAPSAVVAYLALNSKLSGLLKYAATPPSTSAGTAAAELSALLNMGVNAPAFNMAQPNVYSTVQAMLNAVAADPNSGLSATDVTNLLALAGRQFRGGKPTDTPARSTLMI